MKYIQVTQQLKDTNPDWFSNKSGIINLSGGYVLNGLPKYFNSLNYKSGQRTDAYHKLNNSIHEADGFYDYTEPVYNEAIEKLGAFVFDTDHFTRLVEAKTQVEQDDYIQAQEDSDEASNFFNQRMSDGEIYLSRFNAYVYRQVVNGDITKAQAIAGLEFFYDALHPLKMGYFELAKNRVTALNGNAQINILRNKIINELQNYLDNEA